MNRHAFTRVLVRKSRQALATARLILNAGDYDSAVNRSYYAVFDISRAALLKAGVAEDKLPRTHNGVSEAFRLHAVQSGLMDRRLAAELSRTESLRIKADYTDLETDPKIATEAVKNAELFVQTVERIFDLGEYFLPTDGEDHDSNHDDKVSEEDGAAKIEKMDVGQQPLSPEEIRREARENWLRFKLQKAEAEPQRSAAPDKGSDHGRAAGRADDNPGLSLEDDFVD